jgi:hypothetical protein
MARRYGSFTPARRAALRRAQLASAAKRRGRRRLTPRQRKIVKYGAVGTGAAVGVLAARHYASGSYFSAQTHSHGSELNRMVQSARRTNESVRTRGGIGSLYVADRGYKKRIKVRGHISRPLPDEVWDKGGPTLYGVHVSTRKRSYKAGYHHTSVISGVKTRSLAKKMDEVTPRQSYRKYKTRKWKTDRAMRISNRGLKKSVRRTIRGL